MIPYFHCCQNAEPDPAGREKIFAEAEQWIVCDEVAAIPYMYSDTILCVSNQIQGMTFPFVGPRFDFSRAYVVA